MITIKYLLPIIFVVIVVLFVTIPHDAGCLGEAQCITGKVTEIIDGDTIKVDGQSIRFALTSTPEIYEDKGMSAREYVEKMCPIGSIVLVDEDDLQTKGSYNRIIGVVKCNGHILNEVVLNSGYGEISTQFCKTSEFADSVWAKHHGC